MNSPPKCPPLRCGSEGPILPSSRGCRSAVLLALTLCAHPAAGQVKYAVSGDAITSIGGLAASATAFVGMSAGLPVTGSAGNASYAESAGFWQWLPPGRITTPTLLALFTAEHTPNGIELRWQLNEPSRFIRVTLERSNSSLGPWEVLQTETREETGITVLLDRDIVLGRTYYYRLHALTNTGTTLTFGPISATTGSFVREFALTATRPNPTRDLLRIGFTVGERAPVRLCILDVQGRRLATLVSGLQAPGSYEATWAGETSNGSRVRAGVYLVSYDSPQKRLVRRIIWMP